MFISELASALLGLIVGVILQDPITRLYRNIKKWFRSPHVYDFNAFGSAIMQNQEAQQLLKENGADVFTAKNTEDMLSIAEISKEILQKAAPKPHFMTWENFKNTISNLKNRDRS